MLCCLLVVVSFWVLCDLAVGCGLLFVGSRVLGAVCCLFVGVCVLLAVCCLSCCMCFFAVCW